MCDCYECRCKGRASMDKANFSEVPYANTEWREAHITPTDDLIEHTPDDDCICGPECKPVKRSDGSVVYVYVHHSLDGREAHE